MDSFLDELMMEAPRGFIGGVILLFCLDLGVGVASSRGGFVGISPFEVRLEATFAARVLSFHFCTAVRLALLDFAEIALVLTSASLSASEVLGDREEIEPGRESELCQACMDLRLRAALFELLPLSTLAESLSESARSE